MHAGLLRRTAIDPDEDVDLRRRDADLRAGRTDLDQRAERCVGEIVDGDPVIQRGRVLEQQFGPGLHAHGPVAHAGLQEVEVQVEVDVAGAHDHAGIEMPEIDESRIAQDAGGQQFAQVQAQHHAEVEFGADRDCCRRRRVDAQIDQRIAEIEVGAELRLQREIDQHAQLRAATFNHQFELQGTAAHLRVDVVHDGVEQAAHGRAGRVDAGEVGRHRVMQLEHVADLVRRTGEDLVHAAVDHRQLRVERGHVSQLVAQVVDLGQEIQEQLLEVEVEELRQQFPRGAARLRGHGDRERVGNVGPGEDQPGVDQGERRRYAGDQRRDREVAGELQVIGRRVALQVDREEVQCGERGQFVGADQAIERTGDRVAPGFFQVDLHPHTRVELHRATGEADLDETDAPDRLDLAEDLHVVQHQFRPDHRVGVEVEAVLVDPDHGVQQHVERERRLAVEPQLAAEGIDIEGRLATERARHRHVEPRETVSIHDECHVAGREIEAVEQVAQFVVILRRGLQL